MAKKNIKKPYANRRCRECAHHYDEHSPALDGHMILCRCKYDAKSEHGKWCIFLNDIACENFKER